MNQQDDQPPQTLPILRRYCRGCAYDLSGNADRRCPECGREYDPHDLSTTFDGKRRSSFLRIGIALLIVLGVFSGFYHTIIPRPRSLQDWRLWIWLWEPYGIREMWMGSSPGRAYYWAGRISRAEADSRTNPGLRWRIDFNRWTDEWRIRCYEPGIDWSVLTRTYSAMKEPMFGVIFEGADQPVTDASFEFVGNTHKTMSMLVNRFQIRLETFRMSETQPYVWVFDETARRMVPVDITDENRESFRLRHELLDRPLMPRQHEQVIAEPPTEAEGVTPAAP